MRSGSVPQSIDASTEPPTGHDCRPPPRHRHLRRRPGLAVVPVARSEPGRKVHRDRLAQSLAGRRPHADLARHGRRHRLLVVLGSRREALHAGCARFDRIRRRARRGHGRQGLGNSERCALFQRQGRRSTRHPDGGWRPSLRVWRQWRPVVPGARHRHGHLEEERPQGLQGRQSVLGPERVSPCPRGPRARQRRRTESLHRGVQQDDRRRDLDIGKRPSRLLLGCAGTRRIRHARGVHDRATGAGRGCSRRHVAVVV